MSHSAGKFLDHYATLGIDPKSDSETIQQAYARLAAKYKPSNAATGNAEMFESVSLAFEVLSDPEQRALFDKVKGVDKPISNPKFTGVGFFDSLDHEARLRSAILCVLYDRRIAEPTAPSLSARHLELIVDCTDKQLSSALWYLKQRGLATSDDKSSLQVTADGMDFLEAKRPNPHDILPLIKATGMITPYTPPDPAPPPRAPAGEPKAAKFGDGSVLAALTRSLSK